MQPTTRSDAHYGALTLVEFILTISRSGSTEVGSDVGTTSRLYDKVKGRAIFASWVEAAKKPT